MSEKEELTEEQKRQLQLEDYKNNCNYHILLKKAKGEEGQQVIINGDKKSVFSGIELLLHFLFKSGTEKKEILEIVDFAYEHKDEE